MDGRLRITFTAIFLLVPLVAGAQEGKWYLHIRGGKALEPFLGSEDPREFLSVGMSYARPDPRLRFRRHLAEFVMEAQFERSHSHGASGQPANYTDSVGIAAAARYRWGKNFFLDIGWGLQYSDQRTVDLNSRLNSTPFVGGGLSFRHRGSEYLVGARFFHLSNAGLEGDNQGSNQLGFFLAVQFR